MRAPSRRFIRGSASSGSTSGTWCSPDIPGLIQGAHDGHGLGDRFLGHVERCGALIHLVDATNANADGTTAPSAASSRLMAKGSRKRPRSSRCRRSTRLTRRRCKSRSSASSARCEATGLPLAHGAKRGKPLGSVDGDASRRDGRIEGDDGGDRGAADARVGRKAAPSRPNGRRRFEQSRWRARRGLNSQPSVSKTDTLSS